MVERRETPRPVTLRVGPDSPNASRIAAVAERLGVRLVDAAASAGVSTERPGAGGAADRWSLLGDVRVPPDAPDWLLEAALLRVQQPAHVLFLCVANSARSQLAEGIARELARHAAADGAPPPVRISSAGSEPSSVRPQAVTVLAEIGIDITDQRSKGVDDVERPVDAVITLCAEEVCPVWLEAAWRLHWGLPDPAAVEGSEEERLDAFRAVRDELLRRLGVLLTGRPASAASL